MSVCCTQTDSRLTAQVRGELDHHAAREVMEELERQIDVALPTHLTIDLGGLTFTDSSGIAVLLRASRRMGHLRGSVRVVNVPEQARRVFLAAGLDKLILFQ